MFFWEKGGGTIDLVTDFAQTLLSFLSGMEGFLAGRTKNNRVVKVVLLVENILNFSKLRLLLKFHQLICVKLLELKVKLLNSKWINTLKKVTHKILQILSMASGFSPFESTKICTQGLTLIKFPQLLQVESFYLIIQPVIFPTTPLNTNPKRYQPQAFPHEKSWTFYVPLKLPVHRQLEEK